MAKFYAIKVFIVPIEAARKRKKQGKIWCFAHLFVPLHLIVKFRNIKYNEKDL